MTSISTSNNGAVALVLGFTGAIGGAIASALAARGYRIRALARDVSRRSSAHSYAVDWREGDALDPRAVIDAAEGAALIVHAVNPPGYVRWREEAIPMLANTIEAAALCGATILFPANVYVFDETSAPLVDESAPMTPRTRKGRVRLDMEEMLADAAAAGRCRVIAIRAGDFFGPGVTNSWFAQAMAKDGWNATVIHELARPGIGHSFAYVPDLAEAFVRLAERRTKLAAFEMVHFAGHYDEPGRSFASLIADMIGRDRVKIRRFPWILVWLGAPFTSFLREAIEMLWLWRHPLRLDNTKLIGLIGPEPHTPLDVAIAASLGPRPSHCPALGGAEPVSD